MSAPKLTEAQRAEWWRETANRFVGWSADTAARDSFIAFCAEYCAREEAAGHNTSILHAGSVYSASTWCWCAACYDARTGKPRTAAGRAALRGES